MTEEEVQIQKMLDRCGCTIHIEIQPKLKEQSFKDYTDIWNALFSWKKKELWRNVESDKSR